MSNKPLIVIAALVLLTSICCDAKFWRNAVNSVSDDLMERQSCPNPSSCGSGSSTCSSQNCPSGQRCCIDFNADRACCLGTVATTTAPTTAVSTCPVGVDSSFCLAQQVCDGPQDCYPDEICCTLRLDTNPFPCCITNTRPVFFWNL